MSSTCESSETFKIKILPFGSTCSPTMSQSLFVFFSLKASHRAPHSFGFRNFTSLLDGPPSELRPGCTLWGWRPLKFLQSPVYFLSQEACYSSVKKKKRIHSICPGPLPSTPPLFTVREDLPKSLTVLLNLEMQNIQWLLTSFRVGIILLF